MLSKKELRKKILALRDGLSLEERQEKSKIIQEKVMMQEGFLESDILLLFASYKSEVATEELFWKALQMGKKIYYPKVLGDYMEFFRVESKEDFVEGFRGILEPKATETKRYVPCKEDKVCIIMPGAVFDTEGNRIGYGGGYYDKYLQFLNECEVKSIVKMAVAYSCQMVEAGEIQREEHDAAVDVIITDNTST